MRVLLGELAPSLSLLPGDEGALRTVRNTAMQMVEADPASVEARLRAGEVSCVDCGGELRPWGWARVRTRATSCCERPSTTTAVITRRAFDTPPRLRGQPMPMS